MVRRASGESGLLEKPFLGLKSQLSVRGLIWVVNCTSLSDRWGFFCFHAVSPSALGDSLCGFSSKARTTIGPTTLIHRFPSRTFCGKSSGWRPQSGGRKVVGTREFDATASTRVCKAAQIWSCCQALRTSCVKSRTWLG